MKSSIAHLNSRLTNVETNINTIDKNTGKIEAKMEAWKPVLDKIPDLSEKVGELKNWRQIALIIITGVLTTLFWLLPTLGE